MKITRRHLRRIIREELKNGLLIKEDLPPWTYHGSDSSSREMPAENPEEFWRDRGGSRLFCKSLEDLQSGKRDRVIHWVKKCNPSWTDPDTGDTLAGDPGCIPANDGSFWGKRLAGEYGRCPEVAGGKIYVLHPSDSGGGMSALFSFSDIPETAEVRFEHCSSFSDDDYRNPLHNLEIDCSSELAYRKRQLQGCTEIEGADDRKDFDTGRGMETGGLWGGFGTWWDCPEEIHMLENPPKPEMRWNMESEKWEPFLWNEEAEQWEPYVQSAAEGEDR